MLVSQAGAFGSGEWGAGETGGQMTAEDQLISPTPTLIQRMISDLQHKRTVKYQLKASRKRLFPS